MDNTPEQVLSRFEQIEEALIDASSIIYMEKAGFLKSLTATIKLYSPSEVLAETGLDDLEIEPLKGTPSSGSIDGILISSALHLGKAVISEDKKILFTLRREGVPYFNALMMLHFLLFKKRIGLNEHAMCYGRLEKIAWYSPYVLEFGQKIYAAIKDSGEDLLP